MRNLIVIAAVGCATASCSQQSHSKQTQGAEALPMKFNLECQAPTGMEIPDDAKKGFDIAVDRSANKYLLSWEKYPRPIKKIDAAEIVLRNDRVDVGADNNPEDYKIIFNFQTGKLQFEEFYSAVIPVMRMFSASCKIAKNA